ncbi:organic cation transporter protein isoform X1 [Eurytemora carolleeae]|uniref:organic cation transporter protein isoform X1 n=1 Tax=Eurytemora carolleeae TaxID=1294199 RepID=UPI000C790788|nr:organic cation transporter protein isoform X1 [Eurytemora carolleeae]|eukprot:XP_023337932.1 organic cation transporter protein-like isoform X1 [Eurytemora affinis]
MSTLDFDEVLTHVGEIGLYQISLFIMLCIPACLPAAFLAFSQVFLSAEPSHWCAHPELDKVAPHLNISHRLRLGSPMKEQDGKNLGFDSCLMYDVENWTQVYEEHNGSWPEYPREDWEIVPCRFGWIFDSSEYKNTLVTQLELVCDNAWQVSSSTSLFYVGSLIGNVMFGHVADKYGRRKSFFIMLFMEVTLSIALAFSPNYLVFTIIRTVNGLTFPALFQIPFILCLEMLGPAYRTMAGMMLCLVFAVALMILAGLAYMFNTWFNLALITSLPFLSLFVYWWIVPESPRWLLSTGRIDEAEVVVQRIAKWNKKDIPANFIHQMAAQASCSSSRRTSGTRQDTKFSGEEPHYKENMDQVEQRAEKSIFDMIRGYPIARRNFLLITFNWLANALVYNGLSYYSANLEVSSHLGFFISSAVEVPSYFLGWYFMDKWGRRWVLFETMMLGGLSCISCIFVPIDADPWWTVCLAMVGKFQIAASFAVIYVYAGELMPTVVRSQAMGISSFVAGIGLLLFPYINSLGVISRILPLVIMGSFSCLGGVAALFLPETLWTHLPNTLEEGESFGSKFKIFSCPTRRVSRDSIEPTELQKLAREEKNKPVQV